MNSSRLKTALIGLILVSTGASAQDTTGVEFSFDDIEDEPTTTLSLPSWVDNLHISGRFDVNFEWDNPMIDDADGAGQFRNYHKFLFLKVAPNDKVTLDVEILDLSYYEIRYKLPYGFEAAGGKIWVPFGATPFHHHYGARQGDPFQGLLFPNVWSEFGASVGGPLYTGELVSVNSDFYVIKGFEGELGSVLTFTGGGSDGLFAIGGRTKIGVGTKLAVWGSVLYNQFGTDNEGDLFVWGGDILVGYGLVDVPFLRDLQLRAAFARAEIKDALLVDPDNNEKHWYFRYGDYAELSYRGLRKVTPRVRYGTIIDFDDGVSNKDSHNWDVALLSRLNQNLLLLAQWQVNMEEVNEIDNDLFRLQLVFEF